MNAKLESLRALLEKRLDDYQRFDCKSDSYWLTWKGDNKKVILSRIESDITRIQSDITKIESQSNH